MATIYSIRWVSLGEYKERWPLPSTNLAQNDVQYSGMFPWPQPSRPFLSLDLKPRPLPNRNHWVHFHLLLFKSFSNTCSHCSLTLVYISGCKYFLLATSTNIDGFLFLWLCVYSLCLPWTHVQDGLLFTTLQEPRIVVGEAWTWTPLEQSHRLSNIQAFAVSNILTYSMCHLGYVILSFWYSMTVVDNAADAEFTFHEWLVCASHRETFLWLALLAGRQGWWISHRCCPSPTRCTIALHTFCQLMCNVLCLLLLAFCLPLKTRAAGRKFCFFWVEYQYLASDIIDSGFILLPPINSSCWYDFRGYPSFYPSIIYFYSHPYDFRVLSMLLSINCLLPLWFLFIHPSILVSGIKFPITTVGYGSICYQSIPFRSFVLLRVRTCIRYDFCHSDMSKAANDMFLRRSWFFFLVLLPCL